VRLNEPIEDICKRLVKDKALVAECSGFLRAVAEVLQVGNAFAGNANTIRGRFGTQAGTSLPFNYIGMDGDKATAYADKGYFVVGGLTSTEMNFKDTHGHEHKATMGHVVVVVPGGPSQRCVVTLADGTRRDARGGYPYCYQGAHYLPYRFSERTQVDVVFPAVLLPKVVYAWVTAPGRPNSALLS
jgi:hypothetical protein